MAKMFFSMPLLVCALPVLFRFKNVNGITANAFISADEESYAFIVITGQNDKIKAILNSMEDQ